MDKENSIQGLNIRIFFTQYATVKKVNPAKTKFNQISFGNLTEVYLITLFVDKIKAIK